jgi:hypothetical protein
VDCWDGKWRDTTIHLQDEGGRKRSQKAVRATRAQDSLTLHFVLVFISL